MHNYNTEELMQYLQSKNMQIIKNEGKELVVKCVFGSCDADSRKDEAHLYFSSETGQYNCKKCNATGNLVTLKRHFGDTEIDPKQKKLNVDMEKYHKALPTRIREYLNKRGISDVTINKFKLGFTPTGFITIPITDQAGNCMYYKFRQDPENGREMFTTKGAEANLYGLIKPNEDLFITEGEFDCLCLIDKGYNAVTSTHGAGTWKKDWNEKIKVASNIFVCYDNDEAGKNGSAKVLNSLFESKVKNLHQVNLPDLNNGPKTDITDYISKYNCDIEELKTKYALSFPNSELVNDIDVMTIQDIIAGLEPTIKLDDTNKIITFLSMLTAYTDDSQMNLLFNAQSSSGKSHMALEVAKLFPKEDLIRIDSCSRKAFFHENGGEYDKTTNTRIVDLSKKILIFTDQPTPDLMEVLRPLLSHDNKVHISKISDKNGQGGHETKTVHILGYPVFIYCTANSKYDEQEATRFLVLSPEVSQEKISAGVSQAIRSASVHQEFKREIEGDENRLKLIKRILSVKYSGIDDVIIENHQYIENKFKDDNPNLKPRHMRDSKKIIGFIKAFALFNFNSRKRIGNNIYANNEDIKDAFSLWENISEVQELGIPPQIFDIYKKVILPLYLSKASNSSEYFGGITRAEICSQYFKKFNSILAGVKLRQEILPVLESSNLIEECSDPMDNRIMLVVPKYFKKNNSEEGQRVDSRKKTIIDKYGFDINASGTEFVEGLRKVEKEYDSKV